MQRGSIGEGSGCSKEGSEEISEGRGKNKEAILACPPLPPARGRGVVISEPLTTSLFFILSQ